MSPFTIVPRRPFIAHVWSFFGAEMRGRGIEERYWPGDARVLELQGVVVPEGLAGGMESCIALPLLRVAALGWGFVRVVRNGQGVCWLRRHDVALNEGVKSDCVTLLC